MPQVLEGQVDQAALRHGPPDSHFEGILTDLDHTTFWPRRLDPGMHRQAILV